MRYLVRDALFNNIIVRDFPLFYSTRLEVFIVGDEEQPHK